MPTACFFHMINRHQQSQEISSDSKQIQQEESIHSNETKYGKTTGEREKG